MKNMADTEPAKPLHNMFFAIACLIGGLAIVFAGLSFVTNMQVADILTWIEQNFGLTFSIIFGALILLSIIAIHRFSKTQQADIFLYWHQIGIQSANAISTLALTFTLLGISLGIGALSEQSLTPENVNNVISILTKQFSMAFMTTVIGLPTATVVRAWVAIIYTKRNAEFAKFLPSASAE
ncbi:hypothetical protein RM552_04305 [Aestuariibacter sp. P117]|uniref:MotA/TolQ/ExbB proton channel domain-containing protein n=2 Tax=Glaciecola petra TaxID=3075602 RepID=A0ABU2ZN60_9ALTE|nr:hypothetical protein [Aestuariibacter sp. P117]MDT0594060.1 hypothetical protein [Aestuariibacter sp. P117]